VSKRLLVSIIIPVFNEIDYLGRCLDSIASQTVQPDEVIVVDNNSTDGSASLARQYSFVTVITEMRQGVVYARNRGFDVARGEIIGRVDADSVLAPDWVATVRRVFRTSDVGAISGSVGYHHAPFARLFSLIDGVFRHYLAWALGPEIALQGANMALRASVWRASRGLMCNRGGMHEDFDLSIHVREAGFTTVFVPSLHARVAFRQAGSKWHDFVRYALLSPGTYAQHNRIRCVVMYPVVVVALIAYPLLRLLYLSYDDQRDGLSFHMWLIRFGTSERVNPATYVD
jgi:glycosyltransferase involved in cell wall biosynthesis